MASTLTIFIGILVWFFLKWTFPHASFHTLLILIAIIFCFDFEDTSACYLSVLAIVVALCWHFVLMVWHYSLASGGYVRFREPFDIVKQYFRNGKLIPNEFPEFKDFRETVNFEDLESRNQIHYLANIRSMYVINAYQQRRQTQLLCQRRFNEIIRNDPRDNYGYLPQDISDDILSYSGSVDYCSYCNGRTHLNSPNCGRFNNDSMVHIFSCGHVYHPDCSDKYIFGAPDNVNWWDVKCKSCDAVLSVERTTFADAPSNALSYFNVDHIPLVHKISSFIGNFFSELNQDFGCQR